MPSVQTLHDLLSPEQRVIVAALEKQAATLLDVTPRFRYFTLHGRQHIQNLFGVANLLLNAGLDLSRDQAFLLACAICVHDLGMVIPLRAMKANDLFEGKPQPGDPANLEMLIRSVHHELVSKYVEEHSDFLLSLGLSAGDCAIVRDISRCHRKVDLDTTHGYVRSVGALLRIIDELDIGPARAPASVLVDQFDEMDATSCWHWFKHNICEEWRIGHNVKVMENGRLVFLIAVHPPTNSSIPYWLRQVRRPILRVLHDEGAGRVVSETWGLHVSAQESQELSSTVALGGRWGDVQERALSAGRKVILVIDDEVRKMEDLLLPLMQDYHVVFSPNAKDGLDKLGAVPVDLVIVDLQVGSGFQWSAKETQDFKMTGVRLSKEIRDRFPDSKIGILTGSRHDLSEAKQIEGIEFLLKKPVDPDHFEKEVRRVLSH